MQNNNTKVKEVEKMTPKEVIDVLFWTVKIYFSFAPGRLVLMFLTDIFSEIRPIIYAALFAQILDKIVYLVSIKGNISEIYPNLGMLFLYWIVMEGVVSSVRTYARRSIRLQMRSELDRIMYTHIHSLGVQSLENPEVNNVIQRANQWIYSTFDIIYELVSLAGQVARVVTTGVILFSFLPILIPILVFLTIVKFIPDRYFTNRDFHWQVDNSDQRRRISVYSSWLTTPSTLQEIAITGAYNYLDRSFSRFYKWYNRGQLDIISQQSITNFALNLIDAFVSIGAYLVVITKAIAGSLTIGSATFQIHAVDSFSSSLGQILGSVSFLNEFTIKIVDVVKLFKLKRLVTDGKVVLPRLLEPPEIELKNVTFAYPGTDKKIFQNLSLKIKRGEKIAIVGHNGAGKTTLVKLLTRIYRVDEGEILVNGININDLKIDDWHKNIGVLFQDFNFYTSMSVEENIYMGKSIKEIDKEKVIESAKNADAHDFIMEYKKQYGQIMSERFEDGIRPSGGQQQKIAISRFFYRNAPLAVFDEPTSAIDAVSEYNIFSRIYSFFQNKTVIIISHRFSTVRQADRIIVLEKGQIVEEGSHTELLEKKGIYANAFHLQAEGYSH